MYMKDARSKRLLRLLLRLLTATVLGCESYVTRRRATLRLYVLRKCEAALTTELTAATNSL